MRKYLTFRTIIIVGFLMYTGIWGVRYLALSIQHIEIIVPDVDRVVQWSLSPAGDKIMYITESDQTTTQIIFSGTWFDVSSYRIGDCAGRLWLNNSWIYCYKNSIFDTTNKTRISFQIINATDTNLMPLLKETDTIYSIESIYESKPTSLIILGPNYREQPQENYLVTGLENFGNLLAGLNYTKIKWEVMEPSQILGKKMYSPDGKYYFIWQNTTLSIFDATDSAKVTKYSDNKFLELGGWAADSSGVYFQPLSVSGLGIQLSTGRGGIKKLQIPQ